MTYLPSPDGRPTARRNVWWLAVIGAGCVFLERLASEVLENGAPWFDDAILMKLRLPGDLSTPIGPHWLLRTIIDISSLGGVAVLTLITIFAAVYLAVLRQWSRMAYLLVSVLCGWTFENVLKFIVDRPRPTVVPQLMPETTLSFPSGHAMMATITYLTIVALLLPVQPRRGGRFVLVAGAFLLCLMIGACRIYLGVHYPTDVLAGWCAGLTWVSCCYLAGRGLLGTSRRQAG